jgi:hypothetical protein
MKKNMFYKLYFTMPTTIDFPLLTMTRFLGKIQAPWADGFPSGDG